MKSTVKITRYLSRRRLLFSKQKMTRLKRIMVIWTHFHWIKQSRELVENLIVIVTIG